MRTLIGKAALAATIALAAFTATPIALAADTVHGYPWHSVAGAWCVPGYPYVLGNMPAVQPRPEVFGAPITGGTFVLGSGGTSPSSYTPSYDEWIYYRILVVNTSTGAVQAGNWMAVRNAYSGGEGAWMEEAGSWHYTLTSDMYGASGGSNAVSRVTIVRGRSYRVYGEYRWGPIASYGWLAPHIDYLGQIYCS